MNMKQKQAKRSEEYVPTVQEVAENKRVVELCNYYGIPIGVFTDKNIYSKDELIALKYINSNRELPADLAERLLKSKNKRVIKKDNINHNNTEKDVEELFGIKLKN